MKSVVAIACILITNFSSIELRAQKDIPLTDLSFFQDPAPSWTIAGDVNSGYASNSTLTEVPGTGILANISTDLQRGKDIFSKESFGSMDIEMDYLMAPGSNSGIYLQGRYEVQLRDSWGIAIPSSADNGGIYERWHDHSPVGHEGYEGHAPRQNASRAPGLWQHIRISFQAPLFNSTGQKISNARILMVVLNGVTIQENVDLSGPTRGAIGQDEVGVGPLRLQGDHGSVAFRNIRITPFNGLNPELKNLKYEIYNAKLEDENAYRKLKPDQTGKQEIISMNIMANFPPSFLIHYTGSFFVHEAGIYKFELNLSGGRGTLRIKDQPVVVIPQGSNAGKGEMMLPAGEYPFDLVYSKLVTWDKPVVGIEVSGPAIRNFKISDNNVGSEHENPILVEAPVNTILRSFSDIQNFKVTHAVNVGSPLNVHYTYDMDKGTIIQFWRGDFLDVSTMWHGRGDGTAHPTGMLLQFVKPQLTLEKVDTTGWFSDTTGTGFRPKGYKLDEADRPVFRYQIYKSTVNDIITVVPEGHGIHRKILIENADDKMFLKLATASSIEILKNGVYILDDKSYYISLDDPSVKPEIRNQHGFKELIVPIYKSFGYSIIF